MISHPPFMPVKIVARGTPEHKAAELRCAFFLESENQSKRNGYSAIGEYYEHLMSEILTSNTSQMGQLSADPEIPGSSNHGRLTLPNIKAAIKQVINPYDQEFIDGVTKVYVVHPPPLEKDAIRTMSALPAAGLDGHTRLIGVEKDGRTRTFHIEPFVMKLHQAPFESTGWMTIPFNPERPVVEIRVPASHPTPFLDPLYGFGKTENIERDAMDAIIKQLSKGTISVTRATQEPNGETTFPDFEATIGGEEWSIEVTRVLKGIAEGRVIKVGDPRQTPMTIRASQTSPIDGQSLDNAVSCAIAEKSAKAASCKPGNKYCLVLVNVAALNIAREKYDWAKQDLSKFDAVVLLQFHPRSTVEIENLKGNLIPG